MIYFFSTLPPGLVNVPFSKSDLYKILIQINDYTEPLGISIDEFELSIQNLVNLDCITHPNRAYNGEVQVAMSTKLTHLGREVIRACKE